MKRIMRWIYTLLATAFFLFTACEQTSSLKLPVGINMYTDFNQDYNQGNYLKFNELTLRVKSVELIATRADAESIEYLRVFPSPVLINFSDLAVVEDLYFDLPAASYEQIDLYLELEDGLDPALEARGVFEDDQSTLAFRFQVHGSERLHIAAVQNGNSQIDLQDQEQSTVDARLYLDPVFWCRTLSKQNLKMADVQSLNNENVILISAQENPQLFQTVINRIDLKNYLEF